MYSGETCGVKWISTFSTDVKFKCQNCNFCCTGANVNLLGDDISKIDKKYLEEHEHGFSLKQKKDGKCIFLKENCTNYKNRPIVCHEYPFKVTFVKPNLAYIDLMYSCAGVIKRDWSHENTVDFNELVKSKIGIDISRLNSDFSLNWTKINNFSNLLDVYKIFALDEQVSFDYFEKKFSRFYNSYLLNNSPYQSLNLTNNKLYYLENFKITEKSMTEGAKTIFRDYINNFWQRKTTILDFFYALDYLKKANVKISIPELKIQVAKRIVLPLQYFSLAIADINKNDLITEKDAKETIFALDCSLFTPMDSIAPGVFKNNKFFKSE